VTISSRRAVLSGIAAFGAVSMLPNASQAQAIAPVPASLNRVETSLRQVALTFDDGPHPNHTPLLLDILAQWRARATFYVIGQQVRRFPDIARRIVAEGHELGNHTWDHPTLSRMGEGAVLSQIDRAQAQIAEVTGFMPVSMRPPYGAILAGQSRMILSRRAMPTILWSVDPEDWRRPGTSVVARRMLQGARPGGILLAHDIHGATVRAIPEVLEGLVAQRLATVTVSELIGMGRWGPSAPRRRLDQRNGPHPNHGHSV
jgi:peptidoglycan-N-acetylglucosamine deacetylase